MDENSPIYDLFRGVYVDNKETSEMFLTLQLAPEKRKQDLVPLIASSVLKLGKQIAKSPQVLVIELSRHLSEAKETMSQAQIHFGGILMLPESVLTKECERMVYELVAVVVRSGLYTNNGHYWVCNKLNDRWQWINDEVVENVQISQEILNDSRNCSISNFCLKASSNWCLLVYKHKIVSKNS